MPKVIIIHGNGGCTGHMHWYPALKRQLEAEGLEVITPTMPDNILARAEYWLPFLKDKLNTDENTILIGHSSGAVAAMRFAENNKIYGSVLVAACHTDLGDENETLSGYYDHPWQWDQIKANQHWIVQFHSTDDPAIPVEEARHVHQKLGTEYIESTGEGHFTSRARQEEGFPEIVAIIKQKLGLGGT